jgi:predicted HTH transcriptional regulator
MTYSIDLKELATRESEKVEWKENGNDIKIVGSIVKTISAFANDISNFGGGYVVCGAKETKDEYGFPKVDYTGLGADKLKEIEGKVLQHCRDYVSPAVVPIVQELENPGNKDSRILVFIVVATSEAHSYRDGENHVFYVRVSRETREARNGLLSQLLIKKQKVEYFDKRINPNTTEADIDVLLFRDSIREMGLLFPEKLLEDYFSDKEQIAELVPPLFKRGGLDGVLRPRNFTLLLFGKKAAITANFPDAHIVLSIYKGTDRSEPTAERHILTGSIIEQAKKSVELLNTQAYTAFDKTNAKPNQVKYPIRALQEAVINAIVHRDYEIPEPIRITVFSDRIEVMSPGSLHWGVDREKFLAGKASPKWKNQSFAYLFNKLQLAQSEGQGIPTIFRAMKEEGCPDPSFEIGSDSITCVLPAHPRHRMIRELQEIRDKIVLEKLEEAKQQVVSLLATDLYNFRTLDLYIEIIAKQKKPQELYEFLTSKNLDFYSLNPNTLVDIVEILSGQKDDKSYFALANRILAIALSGKIEERQLVKAVVNLKKVGEPEEVVKLIGESMAKYPLLANHATLLEKRATAKMDLAKRCINTTNDKQSNPKTRSRAWEMCRQLLGEAEADLLKALEFSDNPNEKFFIEKDMVFLDKMKKMAQKPQ